MIVQEMEKGMLNIGGGGKQYDLPPMASGDTQVWPNATLAHTNRLFSAVHCTSLVSRPGVSVLL